MCFLPLNHIFEKAWTYLCLSMGCSIAILRDPKKILDALPMVRPTMMSNVPRFWEKVYIGVQEKINQAPAPVRGIMRHAIRVGDRYFFEYINEGKRAPFLLSLAFKDLRPYTLCQGQEGSRATAWSLLPDSRGCYLTRDLPLPTLDQCPHGRRLRALRDHCHGQLVSTRRLRPTVYRYDHALSECADRSRDQRDPAQGAYCHHWILQ